MPLHFPCCYFRDRRADQIGEKSFIGIAGKKSWEFFAEPLAQPHCEIWIIIAFKPVQDERPKQNLASCIGGALLLAKPGLQGFSLRIQLRQAFLD